jgi:hypothetical protein
MDEVRQLDATPLRRGSGPDDDYVLLVDVSGDPPGGLLGPHQWSEWPSPAGAHVDIDEARTS